MTVILRSKEIRSIRDKHITVIMKKKPEKVKSLSNGEDKAQFY